MNKTILLVLTGTLSLSLASCSYISEFTEKRKEIENPPTISVKAQASEEGEKTSDSTELTIESEKKDAVSRTKNVSSLIPSTSPEVRIRTSKRGRQDPFATISVKPKVEIKRAPKTIQKPRPRTRPKTVRNTTRPSKNEAPKVRRPPEIKTTPTIETTKTTKPIPTADLAKNVLITGFVELGDRVKIILQAPEETSSRYVEVGQYVSNGKVLVKRIEPSFPTPVVVLEESGIEVTKVIGVIEEEAKEET